MKISYKSGVAKTSPLLLAGALLLLALLAACGDSSATTGPATAVPATTVPPALTPAVSPSPARTISTGATPTGAKITPVPNSTGPVTTQAAKTPSTGKPELAKPFALKINQTAVIETENITIKFLKVNEDSRCPANVNCVWSGQLIIEVAISRNGQPPGNFAINSIDAYRNQGKETFKGYSLSLVEAAPLRYIDNSGGGKLQEIKPGDYTVTLVLDKVTPGTPVATTPGR